MAVSGDIARHLLSLGVFVIATSMVVYVLLVLFGKSIASWLRNDCKGIDSEGPGAQLQHVEVEDKPIPPCQPMQQGQRATPAGQLRFGDTGEQRLRHRSKYHRGASMQHRTFETSQAQVVGDILCKAKAKNKASRPDNTGLTPEMLSHHDELIKEQVFAFRRIPVSSLRARQKLNAGAAALSKGAPPTEGASADDTRDSSSFEKPKRSKYIFENDDDDSSVNDDDTDILTEVSNAVVSNSGSSSACFVRSDVAVNFGRIQQLPLSHARLRRQLGR